MPTTQLITVRNETSAGVLSAPDFQSLVEGLALQAAGDYNGSPWVTSGLATAIVVEAIQPGQLPPAGAWHIELLDTSNEEGALGYHEDEVFKAHRGGKLPEKASEHSSRGLLKGVLTPLAKVFVKTSRDDGSDPAEVASHEMLEMAVDPNVVGTARTVRNPNKKQIVIVEVADPVQGCGYAAGAVTVADFALPAWFGYPQEQDPARFSFRSSVDAAFELAPGGYISVAPEGEPNNWTQVFGH